MGFKSFRDDHRVPSPLNGEKVAEGRMRGGNAHDCSSFSEVITLFLRIGIAPVAEF